MEDGSVYCWRFEACNSDGLGAGGESADAGVPVYAPVFARNVMPHGGVKVVLFCGTSETLLAAVGSGSEARSEYKDTAVLERRKGHEKPSAQTNAPRPMEADHGGPRSGGLLVLVDLVLPGTTRTIIKLPFVPEFAVYLAGIGSVFCLAGNGYVVLYDVWGSKLYKFQREVCLQESLRITCIAVNRFDEMVAFGTSEGHVLVLPVVSILEGLKHCAVLEERSIFATGETNSPLLVFVSNDKLLHRALKLQLAPENMAHCVVKCMTFTPSVLLVGLSDGKLVAAALVSSVTRHDASLVL
ncbi:hypothetical protein TRVL_00565 [Trypanosoma vivax]|nr:hypothetical protein TRVL_00565 [Trypanosoma vivax]